MTDYFLLLGEPRRPWLDPDSLKAKFLARSFQVHPDRFHNGSALEKSAAGRRHAELNSAYNCLRDPKERLAHLLQLELGAKPKDLQQIPNDLAETFMEVAQHCRQADSFLIEKTTAASPLLQVQIFERSHVWVEKLNAIQLELTAQREALTERLKTLDTQWDTTRANALARREILQRLEELYCLLAFFSRWTGQIQERLARLMV